MMKPIPRFRQGRRAPRNVYDGDEPLFVAPTAEKAAEIVALLNAAKGPMLVSPGRAVTLPYTNYRGEFSERRIMPLGLRYGSSEWHPEPQWFLLAHDMEKCADREFALRDFGHPRPTSAPSREAVEEAVREILSREAAKDGPHSYSAMGVQSLVSHAFERAEYDLRAT